MTQLYLDTEFNGHRGELISMALVHATGWWYGVRKLPAVIDPWVAEHVVPVLDREEDWSDEDFQHTFWNFLTGLRNPEIICDWHADAEHFCRWLDGPTFERSLDWPFRITILKTPPGQPVSERPHNALKDAEALMRWHQAPKPRPTIEELERLLNSEPDGDFTINSDGSISAGMGSLPGNPIGMNYAGPQPQEKDSP